MWSGVKEGAKDVVQSYTGSSKEENIASKVASAGVGGYTGYKSGTEVAKAAVSNATTRVEKSAAEKAAVKTISTVTVKTAAKALGWVGFIPDAITFGKGFYQGFTANGN